MRALALSAWVSIGALAFAPTLARADETCAIEGMLSGADIRVRLARGMRRVRFEEPRRVAITPLRPGIVQVRTLDGEAVEGTTSSPLRFVVAHAIALREGALELPAGMPIERVDLAARGPWVEIAVALGDGLFLRNAPVPCSAITLATPDTVIVARAPFTESGPRWRSRTERLYVFPRREDDIFLRIDSAPESSARLVEIQRVPGWVRISYCTTLGARLRAWTRDTALTRP